MRSQGEVTFLPWLRIGAANQIAIEDKYIDATKGDLAAPRAKVDFNIDLKLTKHDNSTEICVYSGHIVPLKT